MCVYIVSVCFRVRKQVNIKRCCAGALYGSDYRIAVVQLRHHAYSYSYSYEKQCHAVTTGAVLAVVQYSTRIIADLLISRARGMLFTTSSSHTEQLLPFEENARLRRNTPPAYHRRESPPRQRGALPPVVVLLSCCCCSYCTGEFSDLIVSLQ